MIPTPLHMSPETSNRYLLGTCKIVFMWYKIDQVLVFASECNERGDLSLEIASSFLSSQRRYMRFSGSVYIWGRLKNLPHKSSF
jgi:hypothetical protein